MDTPEVYSSKLEVFEQIAGEFSPTRIELLKTGALTPLAIAKLVNCVFWASLMEEEGRQANILVVYLHPEEATETIRFESELDLNPEAIRKLFPVLF